MPMIVKVLDPTHIAPEIRRLERIFRENLVGQEHVWRAVVEGYQQYASGLNPPGRPPHIHFIAGPTGIGKTRTVEVFAKFLTGDERGFHKIDCAEFPDRQDVARLGGSPPGYLGHRETVPLLAKNKLTEFSVGLNAPNIVLFDEIEKAHDAFRLMLLGLMDKGKFTLSDNSVTDFSRTFIFFTSNLAAVQPNEMTFVKKRNDVQAKEEVTVATMKRFFRPEFINRIDHISVMHALDEEQIAAIFDLEMANLQKRVNGAINPLNPLKIVLSEALRTDLVAKGVSVEYGARHLKRVLERDLVKPLSSLMITGQLAEVVMGDFVYVDLVDGKAQFAIAADSIGVAA